MQPSLRIDKSFSYRGAAERWSNRYHLNGSVPATQAEWLAITNALVAIEKTLYPPGVTVVFASGYASDTGPAVYTRDFTVAPDAVVPGTLAPGTGVQLGGDEAFWVRWFCGQTNSRGKKIYLRKYFHNAYRDASGGGQDTLATPQKTAALTFSTSMNGFAVTGYATRAICDKAGNLAISQNVVTFVTTRTLKRRGGSPL